ncbi:IQ-domain [Ranunculus cassubicifolius]
MVVYLRWVGVLRRKFTKSSNHRTIIVNQINTTNSLADEEDKDEDRENEKAIQHIPLLKTREFTQEDIAAIKIQAFFRGYLARRAFRALRSLVKLQALVRGVQVRRQSHLAMHCMHALIRLQVTIRTRQLMTIKAHD